MMDAFQTYQNFLRALYAPSDVVAFAFIDHQGRVEHAFVQESSAETNDYFDKLTLLNKTFSIFAGMNPFKPELVGQTRGRTKENVAVVKRVYVDIDENGAQAVENIMKSDNVPQPTVVLE